MLKKRFFCTLLALLLTAALLPAFPKTAAADTLITGFTLTASGNLPAPQAGDTLYNPIDYISIAATEPAGNEAGLKLYAWWYDVDNGRIYSQSEFASHIFTPGIWQIMLSVSRTGSDYTIDYDNERFISGDLSAFELGGAEFYIYGRAYYDLDYYAVFEIDATGIAPIFVDSSFHDTFNNGDDVSIPFHASGEEPITYAVKSGSVPTGLTLSSDGLLSGVCTSPGTFSFVIEATNAIGSATLPCEITVKDVTRIKAFTLAVDGGVIPVPRIGDYLWFPDNYLTVTSTIPAGNEAGLKVSSRWYNTETNETYNIGSGIGKTFTEGEWELYIFVEPANENYVIDYDGYFADGQSLHNITLGGQPFSAWTNYYGIGYGTYFFLGNTPETIDLQYDATYTLSEISDRMTGKEAHQTFLSSILSRHGSSYYDPNHGGYDVEGWYVDTSSEWTGLTDDPGDPSPLKDSEETLIPQEPYWIVFNVKLAPGCLWNPAQEFTVNGSDTNVSIEYGSDYEGQDPHYHVCLMLLSKEDLSDAEVYGIEPKNYNGSPHTQPKLKVVCNGETLIEGEHYVVSYDNNTDPGYATVKVTGVGCYTGQLYRAFRIFDSEHPHEVIDTVEATSNIDEILAYGNQIQNPTFTVTTGEPAYFETGMGGWEKRIDGEWVEVSSGRFTAGLWRYGCQIRIGIGAGGDDYTLSNRPTCTVDGADWEVSENANIFESYSYTWINGPGYEITGSGELIFNKLYEYNIGITYLNEPIAAYSVAGTVDGGMTPYTFSKTSGPDWITVSADGTVSGTPDRTGANEELVIRVTDDTDAYCEITIYVGMTVRKPEDKFIVSQVVATSDMAEMMVDGGTIGNPTFTVSEGAPAFLDTTAGSWYKKVGDEWVFYPQGDVFTTGVWQYRGKLSIDEGGEDYEIADGVALVVDGKNWTCQYDAVAGINYSYTWFESADLTVHPETCTVTFDSDGGSAVAAQTVAYGSAASKPADPTKNGYTFKGWKLGAAAYDFATPVTEDITLKAQWEKLPDCTVTFDSDGGSAVAAQTVAYGKTASKPADPTKAGYTFLGWYLGTAPYDFSKPVTANITLKAKWEKKETPTAVPTTKPTAAPTAKPTAAPTAKPAAFDGTVEFNEEDVQFKGTTPYVVATGSAQTPRFVVKDADGNTVDASNYDFEYKENVNAGTGYLFVTFKGAYSGTVQKFFKIYLPATTATTVENAADGIHLTWKPVEGAAGYVIYRRAWNLKSAGWTDFVRWNNTTGLEWTDKTVYAGTRYQYGIKAYFAKRLDPVAGTEIGGNVGDNFNLGVVGPLKTTVRITTRKLTKVTAGTKKMTVKWEGSKLFTGYEIQYALNSKFTKSVKTVKVTDALTYKKVIKKLKTGKKYYVRVRSYHVFEGMTYYGQWSNAKSCTVK